MDEKRTGSMWHQPPPRLPAPQPTTDRLAGMRQGTRLAQRLRDFADELDGPGTADPVATALGLRALADLHDGTAGAVHDAIRDQRDRITPYCDINVKVQDGRPVLVEITTKHKPVGSDLAPDRWLYYPPTTKEQPDLTGRLCFGGLGAAGHGCEAAFVLLFPPLHKADTWRVLHGVWTARRNEAIDTNTVVTAVIDAACAYRIAEVAFDPWEMTPIASQLAAAGLTTVEMRQGVSTLSAPIRFLLDLMRTGRIVSEAPVPVDGRLALKEDRDGNMRPDTGKSTGLASPICALVNAMARALPYVNSENARRPD